LRFNDRRTLLFVGGFEHPPNVDAVLFLIKDIFPSIRKRLLDVELLVVGSKMPSVIRDIQLEGVRVLGYVKDIKPLLNSCRVFVAPLRYGAGLKGKIGMAMTAGLPVVTTSIGSEGIQGSRRLMLVADRSETFADSVVRLYTNRELWLRLSKNAREYARQKYSPQAVKKVLRQILADARTTHLEERIRHIMNSLPDKMAYGDPLGSLLSIYLKREDLRTHFPEVEQGVYARLVRWAAANVERNPVLTKHNDWYRNDPWTEIERASARIEKLKEYAMRLGGELETIRQSLIFRTVKRIIAVIDRLLPEGTLRGRIRLTLTHHMRSILTHS